MSGCAVPNQLAPNRQHAQILAMVKFVSNLIDCQCFPRRIQKPIWHVLCCWRVQVFCQAENAAEKKSVLKGAPHFCSCCARQRQKLKPEITIDSEKIAFHLADGDWEQHPARQRMFFRWSAWRPQPPRWDAVNEMAAVNLRTKVAMGHGPRFAAIALKQHFHRRLKGFGSCIPYENVLAILYQTRKSLKAAHNRDPFYITSTTWIALAKTIREWLRWSFAFTVLWLAPLVPKAPKARELQSGANKRV